MIIHFENMEVEAQWLSVDNVKIGLFGNTLFVVKTSPFDRSLLHGGSECFVQDWEFC